MDMNPSHLSKSTVSLLTLFRGSSAIELFMFVCSPVYLSFFSPDYEFIAFDKVSPIPELYMESLSF